MSEVAIEGKEGRILAAWRKDENLRIRCAKYSAP